MSQHLFDRPNSIEELTEQREYIGGIPEKVNENQVSILVMFITAHYKFIYCDMHAQPLHITTRTKSCRDACKYVC